MTTIWENCFKTKVWGSSDFLQCVFLSLMTVGSENLFLSAVSWQDGKESWVVAVVIIINTCLSCQLKQWVLHPRQSVWWIQYRENIFSRQIQWHKRDVGHWAYWPLYLKRWHLKSTMFIFSCLRGLQPTFICLRLYFSTLQCAQGNDDMNYLKLT